jgi:hypothetical protein
MLQKLRPFEIIYRGSVETLNEIGAGCDVRTNTEEGREAHRKLQESVRFLPEDGVDWTK